jgi:imidazolonepropionase
VIARLQRALPLRIVPTFLGAHEIPLEHRESEARRREYVDLLIHEMIPAVAAGAARPIRRRLLRDRRLHRGRIARHSHRGARCGPAAQASRRRAHVVGRRELAASLGARVGGSPGRGF